MRVTVRSRKATVVGDDHERARLRREPPLEPLDAGEVEIVRRLVEEKDVELLAEHRGERRTRLLPARVSARLAFLREIADRERRRRAADAPLVRLRETREQAEERRLAAPVRPDEPDPRARGHDEVDVREDDHRSVRLRDSGRDERAGKARHAHQPPTTSPSDNLSLGKTGHG
jgi:hypothetical protein